ncbi:unnamed protein product [Musa banksii]
MTAQKQLVNWREANTKSVPSLSKIKKEEAMMDQKEDVSCKL